MAKVEIEINYDAVGAHCLRSSEMEEICRAYAQRLADSAKGNYFVSTRVGRTRCNASVATADAETYQANLDNNTLLGAVGVKSQSDSDSRNGKVVQGYYRTLKNGKTIYVQSYQRRT